MKVFHIGNKEVTCNYSLLTEVIYKREFGDALRTDVALAEKIFKDHNIDLQESKKRAKNNNEFQSSVAKQISNLSKEDYIEVMNALSEQFEIFIQILYASALAAKSIKTGYEDFINEISPDDLTPEFMAEIAEFVKLGISPKQKAGQQSDRFRGWL